MRPNEGVGVPPNRPKIYYITHVSNLKSIVSLGEIRSDAQRIAQGFTSTNVGINKIKQRRLTEPEVHCHPGTRVGEYVPFYFRPRSIMLYLLHMGNHPALTYRGGQRPVVHLQADLGAVVRWADGKGRRWAFTTSNAGASYADFYADLAELHRIDWNAVRASDFRDSMIKGHKQAEFLVFESFPWRLVEHIGVRDTQMLRQVQGILAGAPHQPGVGVEPGWYF